MNLQDWESRYYNTVDTRKRREILNERIASGEESEELELIRKLFDERYIPQEKEPERVDHMLRGIVFMKLESKSYRVTKTPKKIVDSITGDLGMPTVLSAGTQGRRIWFLELKHALKTYISSCLSDSGYTSFIWGFGKLKEEQVASKIARDIHYIGWKAPKALQQEDNLALLRSAAGEAYTEMFPKYADLLQTLIEQKK